MKPKQKLYQITKQKFLSDSELAQLRSKLTACTDVRHRLLIELALETGARCSEILALTRDSLCHEEKSVLVIGLKKSFDREIPLSDDLWARLIEYSKNIPDGRLFTITRGSFWKIWTHYRPCDKPLHALRHTRAIQAYKKANCIQSTRQLLGHKSISNTMVYATCVQSIKELREKT